MQNYPSVGCVVMASGLSTRFGSNKLLADFCGRPMLCRTLDAVGTPLLPCKIVVTRSEGVQDLCREHGIPVLLHSLPGRNDTVRLGLSALLEQQPGLSGCMFLPGDQPLLCRETVEQMVDDFRALYANGQKETEQEIFRLGYQSKKDSVPLVGSPVLFGCGYFPELCTLPEGRGGSMLLRKYPAHVHIVYTANREELADADTPEALEQLKAAALRKR